MRKLATLFWILSNELKFEKEFACILTNFKMEHRVASSQLECLVGFLEEHPQLARGATGLGGRSKETIDRKWRELADILNAIENGAIKDGYRWKKYWKDLRLRVKAKASHLRQEATATGGGTPNSDKLSSMDRRILAFVGEEVVEGDRTHYVSFLPPASATTLPASTSQEMSPAVVRQLPAEDMQATPQMPTNSPQGASATPTGGKAPAHAISSALSTHSLPTPSPLSPKLNNSFASPYQNQELNGNAEQAHSPLPNPNSEANNNNIYSSATPLPFSKYLTKTSNLSGPRPFSSVSGPLSPHNTLPRSTGPISPVAQVPPPSYNTPIHNTPSYSPVSSTGRFSTSKPAGGLFKDRSFNTKPRPFSLVVE
ncbi:unnamed protein product [Callosobruchus maculatus]|uniref:Uncharacterized protein n=1 Tax=Callosobruchus maculatus TaxID=64391 RepID=A0A653DUQ1_CALMS|nr:unnamed protein product [Callosobruchus maculatus]